MRRLVPLIILIVLLTTRPAGAKELAVEVCGAAGCVSVSDRGQVGLLPLDGRPEYAAGSGPLLRVSGRLRAQSAD